MRKQNRVKHDYTNELELKTLIIRINNKKEHIGTPSKNKRIDELVNTFAALNKKDYIKKSTDPKRRAHIKSLIKDRVIYDSIVTSATQAEEERFGKIIMLMTKNILKKPKFSGYTYKDEFYSDASYKILRYLHNFDHTLTSIRTGDPVNAFAYISQIIHNSIVYIIKKQNKETQKVRSFAETSGTYDIPGFSEIYAEAEGHHPGSDCIITKYHYIDDNVTLNNIDDYIKETINTKKSDKHVQN